MVKLVLAGTLGAEHGSLSLLRALSAHPNPATCTSCLALAVPHPARPFLQAVAVCVSKTAVGAAYVAIVAEALPALPADLAPAEEDSDFVLASGAAPAGAQKGNLPEEGLASAAALAAGGG